MPDNDTTTKFKVDISELKSQFQEAQRTIRIANSEFKAATAGMDNWSSSADGLSAKLRQLSSVLDSEKSKLASLERQYELTVAEQGETSRGAQELLVRLNNQRAAVANVEREIGNYTRRLNDLTAESNQTESSFDRLSREISDQENELNRLKRAYSNLVMEQGEGSSESKALARQISNLSSEIGENRQALANAERAADSFDNTLDDLEDTARDASDGFTVFKGAVATFAGNVATSLASGVKSGISSIVGLSESTREYRSEMAKLETAYETAGFTADQAKGVYKDFYAVLGDEGQAVEAVNHLAKLTDSQKDLEKWTTIATGVYATFGASLPIEGLTEAANETAKVGQVTGPLADALNWAGVSEDKFNESLAKCSSEQERQKLIMDTLNGLYSDAAKKYEDVNGNVMDANRANSDYTDTLATLGEKIEPVTTSLKEGFNELLKKVLELVEDVDMEEFTSKIEEGFDVLIEDVIPAVKEGFGWILDHKDEIIAGLAGIAAGFIAFKVVSIIQSVTAALKGMSVAQAALNLVMSANPIGLVIAAVAGLIAIFVTLWNKCDWFREFWINLWEQIKDVVEPVWEAIVEFFKEAWEQIKIIWDMVKPYFEFVWNNIKTIFSVVVKVLSGFFKAAWEAIQTIWNYVKPYFEMIWNNIKTIFSTVKAVLSNYFEMAWTAIKAIWDTVKGYFEMVWNNIKAIFSVVKAVLSGDFDEAWEGIKKIWNNVKGYFQGVWDNIKKIFSAVKKFFKDSFSDAWEGIKGVFSNVGEFFGGIWDTIKEKFTSIGTKVADAIGGAFKSAINAVIGTVEGGLNLIPTTVNKALDKINELPGVDIGKLDTISLPRLAKGGIVSKATAAIIGEDGKEAVMPLERNLGWIHELADKLATKMREKTYRLREASQSVVNNYFNQTNNSPKPLNQLDIYRQSKNLLNMKG